MRRKYHLAITSKVVMVDYDAKEGDLYIRFKEAKHTEGEPSEDGLVIFHRDRDTIAAIEILDLADCIDHNPYSRQRILRSGSRLAVATGDQNFGHWPSFRFLCPVSGSSH